MFFFQTRKLNERSKEIFERVKSIQKEIEEREKKNTQRKDNLNYIFKTKIFA
jgi:cell shape-determining protein MreC